MYQRLASAILLMLAVLALAAWPVFAQPSATPDGPDAPIGKIISASGSATVEHAVAVLLQANLASGVTPVKTGDFVYQGDVIQTGADGKLGITFKDGTAFNISSNGRMVLDRFIYDPKSNANSTLISLSKGNFTFVAGAIARTGDMKVDTPVGTMGIRGTTPHVEIRDDGSVKFSTLIEGKKDVPAASPSGGQRRVVPAQQRRAAAPSTQSPEQAATYNRLLNYNPKICQNC